MATAFLGIGSNVADARYRILKVMELLPLSGCRIEAQSDIYQVSSPYYNLVTKVSTELTYHALLDLSKYLESQLGRLPHAKGDKVVPMDIDIVVFDDAVMRDHDFNAAYFSLGYDRITGTRPLDTIRRFEPLIS